jgi:hypothetical protein
MIRSVFADRYCRRETFMILLLRRLALFFAMLSGIVCAQFPEYAQQYRQRLGGALDELNAIIARFDADASQNGFSEREGVTHLQENPDSLVRAQGNQMKDVITRRNRLAQQAQTFADGGSFTRVFELATQADPHIAWRAYQSFEPGVPVTGEGFISALIGFVIGGGLIRLMGWPFERYHRRRRRRTLPESSFAA